MNSSPEEGSAAENPYLSPHVEQEPIEDGRPKPIDWGPLRFSRLLGQVFQAIAENPGTFVGFILAQGLFLGMAAFINWRMEQSLRARPEVEFSSEWLTTLFVVFNLITLFLLAWYHTGVIRVTLPMLRRESFSAFSIFEMTGEVPLVFLAWLATVGLLVAGRFAVTVAGDYLGREIEIQLYWGLILAIWIWCILISLAPAMMLNEEKGVFQSYWDSIRCAAPYLLPIGLTFTSLAIFAAAAASPLLYFFLRIWWLFPLAFLVLLHPIWCITSTLVYFHLEQNMDSRWECSVETAEEPEIPRDNS